MLLESPVEEILKALPEEDREDHLQMRLGYILFSVETLLNQLNSPCHLPTVFTAAVSS